MINGGNALVDNKTADRFRFQPIASEEIASPASYEGTSGGGLWQFFLDRDNFSVVQARLVGVAYWQKPVGKELHIVGHAQIGIYGTMFNDIRQKWR